ncbi:right-handed parallel beta-helix repeat-containing protein [Solibacillus cecembensis]|uniref:right-handed parallel beta-helix repeat-containing protein n=1 Tax=Solibacillus cecembensis TaxID=459347 RepID=UPI003D071E98
MTIIKVSTSIFSKIKTVKRALEKAQRGDQIYLAGGKYKESITIHEHVTISGHMTNPVLVEGVIIIAKSGHATLENMAIYPSMQILVEGELTVKNCTFNGLLSNAILSFNSGKATFEDCTFSNAKDVAIAFVNQSHASFAHCAFDNNEKAHLLVENSTVEIKHSEFSNARHAIWAKSHAHISTENVKIHHHSGTQIIIQNESTLTDCGSTIENGDGNGIYATEHTSVTLTETTLQHHHLPQLWIQKSKFQLDHCFIQHGQESGLMLREFAEGTISNTLFSSHKIANIQLTMESLLHMTNCQIVNCQGVGVQVREKSILNFSQTTFEANVLSQLFVTEKSICSLKDSTIKDGKQVGIFVEKEASVSVVTSILTKNDNSGATVIGAELVMMECELMHNKGNGILAANQATMTIDNCQFQDNYMPHIAGKEQANVAISNSEFTGGKSIFMLEDCQLAVQDSTFQNALGTQIELASRTKATIHRSTISGGTGNAIKVMKDASLEIFESQISSHQMPQIVINDSSLIFKNSELLQGERNGLIIENNAEAFIQDSFISNHKLSQIWMDADSTVELSATQITEGHESDFYVQNRSSLHATDCIIQNERFNYNVQAINHSKIELVRTSVENSFGEKFYSENNSLISHTFDEVSD